MAKRRRKKRRGSRGSSGRREGQRRRSSGPTPRLSAEMREQIVGWAEEAASAEQLELYDIELVVHGRWIIRVYIDIPGPIDPKTSVSAGQCEQVSRYLEAYLDAEEGVPQNYLLEVSSPGIERALRTAAHYRLAIGQNIQLIVRKQVDGQNKVVGELVDFQDEVISLRLQGAEEPVDIQWADVKEARLKYDFDF